jgi:hypothetical protein
MNENSSGRRRLWRFAGPCGCLLVIVVSVWIGWSVQRVRERDQTLVEIELGGGSVVFPNAAATAKRTHAKLPLAWRVLGAKPVSWLLLPDDGFREADWAWIRELFPEARVASLSERSRRIQ